MSRHIEALSKPAIFAQPLGRLVQFIYERAPTVSVSIEWQPDFDTGDPGIVVYILANLPKDELYADLLDPLYSELLPTQPKDFLHLVTVLPVIPVRGDPNG